VGLYVPGGLASYPSSLLMNAIPAKVAGVPRLAMAVPAPDGHLNPLVLAAAKIAGVDEIYRMGGAQAIGALAYGTATIPAVDKIVGPGNAYVATAKRQVFGTVGIEMIAGPSEILVLADGNNDPDWIAADLLSQAEHDTAAQSILITDDQGFAERVLASLTSQLADLPKADIAGASWDRFGCVILVDHWDEAVDLVDRIAPEHLAIALADDEGMLARVRNAGSIFLGAHSPEPIGDYIAGPNHVLPTARGARFSSGLSVLDFMKRSSIIRCTADGLALDISNMEGRHLTRVLIPLTPFRRVIKDYFTICESYFQAIKTASPSKIEAIDMGRRGLHNDGSDLLRARLDGKITVDNETARRLFTLICILQIRS
jgi:histidinol dehydrogenase